MTSQQPQPSQAPKLKDPPLPVREQIARVLLEKGPNASQEDIGSHRNNLFYADKVRARPEYIRKWKKQQQHRQGVKYKAPGLRDRQRLDALLMAQGPNASQADIGESVHCQIYADKVRARPEYIQKWSTPQQADTSTPVVRQDESDQALEASAIPEATRKENGATDASTLAAADSASSSSSAPPNPPVGGNNAGRTATPPQPSTQEAGIEDAAIALHSSADEFKRQIRELAHRRASALGDIDLENADVARIIPILRTAKDNALILLRAALDDFINKHSDAISQLPRIPVEQCKDFVNAWARESQSMWSTLITRLTLVDLDMTDQLHLDQIERRAEQPRADE